LLHFFLFVLFVLLLLVFGHLFFAFVNLSCQLLQVLSVNFDLGSLVTFLENILDQRLLVFGEELFNRELRHCWGAGVVVLESRCQLSLQEFNSLKDVLPLVLPFVGICW